MIAKFTTFARTNQKELIRFFKFSVVGLIGAVVDFGVYRTMMKVFGLSPEVASVIALATAIVSNFIWNRYWTYPDSRSKPILKQFVQFFFINILAVIIRVPTIAFTKVPFGQLVERVLSIESETATNLGYYVAWALAVGLAMFWNFFINRMWTYSDAD
ncbi:MAG: GtrA family protein [Chloroflexi bacterium]|nr:GtrA family protein [Chloroflexota bacterium]